MSHELEALKSELTIEKQKNEIAQLRNQLEKKQAEKSSRLEDSLFSPALFPHYQQVAEKLAKSSVIPTTYRNKPEDIFVAMAMGYQLGFPVEQSLQDIAVINGRPCLWGDGLLSLCLNHPECEAIEENPIYNNNEIVGYSCLVKRKNHKVHVQEFTFDDATRAGLLQKGGVWNNYPIRMLQMRARSLALRDKFADALRGLRIADIEKEDNEVIEGEYKEVTQAETLNERLKSNDSQRKKGGNNKDNAVKNEPKSKSSQEKKEQHVNNNDAPATEEQKLEIDFLIKELNFTEERKKKAFDYFKIKSLEQLTFWQAEIFLTQLGKES